VEGKLVVPKPPPKPLLTIGAELIIGAAPYDTPPPYEAGAAP